MPRRIKKRRIAATTFLALSMLGAAKKPPGIHTAIEERGKYLRTTKVATAAHATKASGEKSGACN